MSSNNTPIFIGCMTGTSVDGLDLAAVTIADGHISIVESASVDMPKDLTAQLIALGQPHGHDELDAMGVADVELGRFIGEAVNSFIRQAQLPRAQIAAIGNHGQTVRHRPGTFTLQIGDANQIAEITGITTVADFRRRDVASGGQGAPLVPPFHQAMFGGDANHEIARVILNIGGISNITLLGSPVRGFDTGPGNGLMDSWISKHKSDATFDRNGDWAARGRVDENLLEQWLAEAYFAMAPPKSTGREHFNLAWLEPQLDNQSAVDVQATLCELTARSITDAISRWGGSIEEIIVCGGGRRNAHLMTRIQSHSNARVHACEYLNIEGDSLEAAAFAWLAYQRMAHLPGNEPAVTGAQGYRVLGAIYPP